MKERTQVDIISSMTAEKHLWDAFRGITFLVLALICVVLSLPITWMVLWIIELSAPSEWGPSAYWTSAFTSFISMWFLSLIFLILAFWRGGKYTRILCGVLIIFVALSILGTWLWSYY